MRHLKGNPEDEVNLVLTFPHGDDDVGALGDIIGTTTLGEINTILEDGVMVIAQVFDDPTIPHIYSSYWYVLSDGRDDLGAVVLELVRGETLDQHYPGVDMLFGFDPEVGPADLRITLPRSHYLLFRAVAQVRIVPGRGVKPEHVGDWDVIGGEARFVIVPGFSRPGDHEVGWFLTPHFPRRRTLKQVYNATS
ncbi:hypothetical protein CcrC1_gp061c [Caulobacter phage C1]|nr:hypothetical protein CcrC1_gp061c [Caulobacter phage C1]UTU08288.1 hypothetical protein CcrC2_gp060c [Caulobacter phage C2]UTU08811.1 hypothetical protein CcrJ4_gp060c [Caulobacter phage J4]UTU09363.1 hypothetical protein CcrBL47_gp077c [Caulobacter phage BL47]UTU09923.1 hypothetical protein CcrRB23_gp061c [Caulobacter phage RB23]WGN96948.1 hypothetical protein [Bertelyvirus sp.]